jgi:hypothetical protein
MDSLANNGSAAEVAMSRLRIKRLMSRCAFIQRLKTPPDAIYVPASLTPQRMVETDQPGLVQPPLASTLPVDANLFSLGENMLIF